VPREIYGRPATEWIAGFIGDTNFVRVNGKEVAVRPERLRVVAGGTGLGGTVSTTRVIGPAVQCVVRLDDGQEVLARQQRSGLGGGIEALAEGERVYVSWADDEALEFDEGGNE
jgi:ABC-type Fe3+/spermidine/putrescine transport system ATPase subunit